MEVPVKDLNEPVELTLGRSTGSGVTLTKRVLDFTGAFISIMLFFPLGLLIALLIKLDSRGPVLFIQERMGQHGQGFKMLKFRTMYVDAEERLSELLHANPRLWREYETYHKLQHDPRVTWVGRLLRKYSLDEFPQFWNVLKGEMSLVGPRPYLPRERQKMDGAERIILKVPPGLTGFWQVHARNGVCFQDRLEMDIRYIQIRSMWLDILLMCRTFVVILRGKDAC
ncbi:MAG: sugar transferase [Rhodothermales bacterium]